MIAECLGLDSSKFNKAAQAQNRNGDASAFAAQVSAGESQDGIFRKSAYTLKNGTSAHLVTHLTLYRKPSWTAP